jgi:hypothetical protein
VGGVVRERRGMAGQGVMPWGWVGRGRSTTAEALDWGNPPRATSGGNSHGLCPSGTKSGRSHLRVGPDVEAVRGPAAWPEPTTDKATSCGR